MKRTLIFLLATVLLLSTVLVSCKEKPSNNPDAGKQDDQNPPAESTAFLKTENYLPTAIYEQMKTYFESATPGFYPYDDRINAPYVCSDMFTISNCTVKSITIPVFSTGEADADGNFTFSIFILPNDAESLRVGISDASDPIVVKINAAEYDLEAEKSIRKFIKVDLTEYDISLSATETLGFSHKDDTLIPARVLTKGTVTNGTEKEKYVPAKYMIDNWGVVGYYFYDAAAEALDYVDNSLLFDFELERTFESEAAYNALIAAQAQADADYAAKLAAVKAAYAGKSISVLGDSISTFGTISDDPALGLGDNPAYSKYKLDGAVYTYEKTYWGGLAAQTDMELCVINSWGAGMVYGREKYEGKDGMLLRSYNLATATKTPDLILLSYGINDMGSSYSSAQDEDSSKYTGTLTTGNLYQRLTAANKTKTDKEIVDEWFTQVKNEAKLGGYDPEDPSTITYNSSYKSNIYSCWEAAYALSLQNIKTLYGDAEIFCVSLPDRNHPSSTQPRLSRANVLIRALAEYFEVGFIDQSQSGVNRQNCLMYGADSRGLHPSVRGHAALTKVIVEALYEKLPKN